MATASLNSFHSWPILVTGATGFIGMSFINRLRASGANVSGLVRGKPGDLDAACADLLQPRTLKNVCAGKLVIMHFAGHAHAWADKDGDGIHHKVTVEGTRNLLEAAGDAGVKRFIFFSSVKASGEGGPQLLDETSLDLPVTAYGRAKREAEELVLDGGRRFGIHVCNLRLTMVYGVGMKGNLPRMIEAIEHDRFPPLPDTDNKRSMVWVEDVVQAALLAAQKPEANGMTYIVTDNQAYSTRRIYEAICAALGKPVSRWTIPLAAFNVVAKIGDVIGGLRRKRFPFDSDALKKLTGSAYYSSAKIQRELGFYPTKKLEDVLPDIISDYRARGIIHR